MIKEIDWISDVLNDLVLFCEMNELKEIAERLTQTNDVIRKELGERRASTPMNQEPKDALDDRSLGSSITER